MGAARAGASSPPSENEAAKFRRQQRVALVVFGVLCLPAVATLGG
jgi:hypothetical protein